ncbi:MAG TPA: hypothetical protein VFI97_09895 [Arthrobacter sp.]|nr:hypothetical protein [Arthrobacter sp.]
MNSSTTGDFGPVSATRYWMRRRWAVACILAAAVVLTGCTDEPSSPATEGPQPTPTPDQSTDDITSPPAEPPEPSASASPSATASGQWGRYGNRSDACTAVAADVVAIAVLPMSLNLSDDATEIDNAEDEIEVMKRSAPAELTADFARVQLLIDSFGEQVAAGERGGGEDARLEGTTDDGNSGVGSSEKGADDGGNTVQSPPTDSADSMEEPEFDSDALQDALDPVKQWLTENCEESPEE